MDRYLLLIVGPQMKHTMYFTESQRLKAGSEVTVLSQQAFVTLLEQAQPTPTKNFCQINFACAHTTQTCKNEL